MKNTLVLSSLLTLFVGMAHAQQDQRSSQNTLTATEKLLQQQRTGQSASAEEQYLDGKVRSTIYKRYVESFSHRIPERYTEDSFVTED